MSAARILTSSRSAGWAPTSTARRATRSCIRSADRPRPSSRSTPARISSSRSLWIPGHRYPALTLEVWVRRWRTIGRQAIISQFDRAGSLRLRAVRRRGRFAGLLPRRRRRLCRGESAHDAARPTAHGSQPAGLEDIPRQYAQLGALEPLASRRRAVRRHRASRSGSTAARWRGWKHSGPVRPGGAALRIGAAGQEGVTTAFLDADIAMPAIYARALSPAEIAARFADRGLSRPTGPDILACWPLDEERGERAADASPSRAARADHQSGDMDDRRARASMPMCPGSGRTTPPRIPAAATVCGWPPMTCSTADGRHRTNTGCRRMPVRASTRVGSASRSTAKNACITRCSS